MRMQLMLSLVHRLHDHPRETQATDKCAWNISDNPCTIGPNDLKLMAFGTLQYVSEINT